jgi:hypothetical protein
MNITDPEAIARAFHEAYERLAPNHGYETRKASAKPWEEVPEANRRLMIAVAAEVAPLIAAQALREDQERTEWGVRWPGVAVVVHGSDSIDGRPVYDEVSARVVAASHASAVAVHRRAAGPWIEAEGRSQDPGCCNAPNMVWEHSRDNKDHFRCVACGGGMTKARATS